MSICGSFNTCLLAMLLSKESSKEGNKIRLASMANNKVAETKAPKATVPPKLDIMKTEKPKKSTMEV